MNAYHFRAIPFTAAGKDCIGQLGQMLTQHFPGSKHALLLADPGIAAEPVYLAAREALHHVGLRCHEYLDIVSNPPPANAHDATEIAREYNADIVIGLGGGSVMDVAKRTRHLMRLADDASPAPLILVPTNPGSCAVTTDRSHAWHSDGQVQTWQGPHYLPDAVLIDHQALASSPDLHVAAAAMHAIGIAAENMVRAPNHPLVQCFARTAIPKLTAHLIGATEENSGPDCRAVLSSAAYMAGLTTQANPESALSWLSAVISGTHRLPVNLVTAVLLPAYLTELRSQAPAVLAQMASLALPLAEGSDEARTTAFIVALQQLNRSVGLECTLPQLGVQERDLPELIAPLQNVNNGQWLDQKRAQAILTRAMELCG